jgi:carbohydrate-selective porin OprB
VPLGFSLGFDFDVADFGIFGRLGVRDKDLYARDFALSLGFIYTGPALGEDNALGFGLVTTKWSADFIAAGGGPASDGNETQVEIFYRWMLPAGVEIIPDLQIVVNPGGDTAADTLTIFGVRVHTPF